MRMLIAGLWLTLLVPFSFAAQSTFDPDQNTWVMGNGWVQAVFQLSADGHFLTQEISDLRSGDRWTASPNRPGSPILLTAGRDVFDAQRQYALLNQFAQSIA